jgi:dipeptidase
MPFYPGSRTLPDSLQRGNPLAFDRRSMWTAFNYVANYAMLKYSAMIEDITGRQKAFEVDFFGRQPDVEAEALRLWQAGDQAGARKFLAGHGERIAAEVLKSWWNLSETLYIKYNDGYLNTSEEIAQPMFYPPWWLKAVGYEQGPVSYAENPGTE